MDLFYELYLINMFLSLLFAVGLFITLEVISHVK